MLLEGEVRPPGLATMGGACSCCTNELLAEDEVIGKEPDVFLRPLKRSKTVLRLFLLTCVIPLGLPGFGPDAPAVGELVGLSKLAVGLGAILGKCTGWVDTGLVMEPVVGMARVFWATM